MFDWLSKIVVVYSVSTLMVYVLLIDFSFFGALTDVLVVRKIVHMVSF